MTASPEVRQLAERLYNQQICQTMAAAFQMAESMLVTSDKVLRDFNPKFEKKSPLTHPIVAGFIPDPKDPLDEDKDDKEEDEDHQEEEKTRILPSNPKPLFTQGQEPTLKDLMEKQGELKFVDNQVHFKEEKPIEPAQATVGSEIGVTSLTAVPEPSTQAPESATPTPPVEAPVVEEKPRPAPVPASGEQKNGFYQKVDLTAVFGKH